MVSSAYPTAAAVAGLKWAYSFLEIALLEYGVIRAKGKKP
jgi:hypothetical protein